MTENLTVKIDFQNELKKNRQFLDSLSEAALEASQSPVLKDYEVRAYKDLAHSAKIISGFLGLKELSEQIRRNELIKGLGGGLAGALCKYPKEAT